MRRLSAYAVCCLVIKEVAVFEKVSGVVIEYQALYAAVGGELVKEYYGIIEGFAAYFAYLDLAVKLAAVVFDNLCVGREFSFFYGINYVFCRRRVFGRIFVIYYVFLLTCGYSDYIADFCG